MPPEPQPVPADKPCRLTPEQEKEVLARLEQVLERLARANAAFSDDELEADLRAGSNEIRGRMRT